MNDGGPVELAFPADDVARYCLKKSVSVGPIIEFAESLAAIEAAEATQFGVQIAEACA